MGPATGRCTAAAAPGGDPGKQISASDRDGDGLRRAAQSLGGAIGGGCDAIVHRTDVPPGHRVAAAGLHECVLDRDRVHPCKITGRNRLESAGIGETLRESRVPPTEKEGCQYVKVENPVFK